MADTAAEEVGKVLNSGFIGQGSKVDEFENKLIIIISKIIFSFKRHKKSIL